MSFPAVQRNQRVITVPTTPQVSPTGTISSATTTVTATLTLSASNISAGSVWSYIHYYYLWARTTAAASQVEGKLQWQFRNAAHVNVGAAVDSVGLVTACNGASVFSFPIFAPVRPHSVFLVIPATATEVVLQIVSLIGGAPSAYFALGYGIDATNIGAPGEIGGNNTVGLSPTNINEF